MTGNLVYLTILFVLCFLYSLNLFLRGRLRPIIEGILSLLIIVAIVLSFFIFNWKFGLLVLFLTFVFVGLARPLASALATRILGYRTGVADDYGSGNLDKILDGRTSMNEYFEASRKEEGKRAQKFQALLRKPRFTDLVVKYSLTPEMLEDYYRYLGICALQDLAWEIIENPVDLEKLIILRNEGKSDADIFSEFREFT